MILSFCLGLSLLLAPTLAYPSFQDQVPNSLNIPHPCKPNYRWPGVGHINPLGGGERNVFGEDFRSQGYFWSQTLCRLDSDGDGRTNGEELGDPNCVWSVGQIPERTTDITHPGVCDPYDSEFCRDKTTWVDCEEDRFEACDALNSPDVMTYDMTFIRHQIPATETNYYCMTFDLPQDQDYHISGDEGIVDNANVLHHMLLYACKDPDEAYIPTPQPCGMSAEGQCGEIISAWTVGLPGTCHGDNVGYRFGLNGYKRVRLEIHYNNPALVPDYFDASGLRIYYQPVKPGVQDLLTYMTGQTFLEIPPGESRVEKVGVCPGSCTQYVFNKPFYVIRTLNHMHYMGRSMKIEVFRNGRLLHTLSDDKLYSYDSPVQWNHDPPLEIQPGDEIKTTCVYSSLSSKRWVYYGEGTSDEMCFGFLTIYPADAVEGAGCVSLGPLDPCTLYSGAPLGACDWKTYTNLSNPESRMRHAELAKNCNLNGFCRPECKEVLEEMWQHPCLQGDAYDVTWNFLQTYKEGVEYLGRLHSCKMADDHGTDCREECSKYCWNDDDDNIYNSAHKMAATSVVLTLVTAFLAYFM